MTRSNTNFAVQLGAGRSVEALKLSWSLLLDQHGDALSPLQPRLIAPRTDGGSYRLVAGPFDSRGGGREDVRRHGAEPQQVLFHRVYGRTAVARDQQPR